MRAQTIICANARLAHCLRQRHAQERLRLGNRAWESPDILPWQAWLLRLWNTRREDKGLLLSGEQERVLWQQVIDGSTYRDRLLQTSSVAAQAATAWRRLKQHRVPIFPEGISLNEDAAAFKTWADEFRAICGRNNWIDQASMADSLPADTAAGPDACDTELVLVGFDRFTPQQTLLCEGLEKSGVGVSIYPVEDRNESVQTTEFADIDEEIRAAAAWARRCIETGDGNTAGIIAPDLRRLRTRIHHILEDMLAPGNLYYRNTDRPLPFSVSAGQPLADYPLINVIFSLLALSKAPPGLDVLGVMLRTPFVKGHNTEYPGRALLDEKLRSRRQLAISWNDLLYLAGRNGQAIPILAGMMQDIHSLLAELPARRSPESWAASFTRFLDILGWPGDRTPDSAEYQQVQAWNSALDKLVSLRVVRPQMTRTEALAHLRRIAEGTGFQPESAETPVQVLDPQGAAAMAFDNIWMLGLSEDVWPPRPKPNPFIPIALQKQYRMPGADADQALEQAGALQEALVRSTPRIILSYARNDADRPLLASPLLQGLPPGPGAETRAQVKPVCEPATVDPAAQPFQVVTYSQTIFEAGATESLESIADGTAPPVAGGQRGGSALFRDQSQCPFQAFARHRLRARQPEQADIGLDAMARGILLHRLMEHAWSRLKSREKLAALTEQEREDFSEALARDLIREARKDNPLFHSERFATIECARLARILREWLVLELQREPFSVDGMEAEIREVIAGVEFTARLDRVDALADGRRVIIDYKSGRAGANTWMGDRPHEPQLPLYAATCRERVAAVAYARLRRGKDFGFDGLAEAAGILPDTPAFEQDRRANKHLPSPQNGGTSSGWEQLLLRWRAVLESLADEFRRGVATVTPQRGACDRCEQQPLCRIHEVNAQRSGRGRDD